MGVFLAGFEEAACYQRKPLRDTEHVGLSAARWGDPHSRVHLSTVCGLYPWSL